MLGLCQRSASSVRVADPHPGLSQCMLLMLGLHMVICEGEYVCVLRTWPRDLAPHLRMQAGNRAHTLVANQQQLQN